MSSEKDLRKLVNDIATYRDEKHWLDDYNTDELFKNGKISEEDAEGIKKRQDKAAKRIRKLESDISRPLIRMFPQRFREKVPTEKIAEIGIVGDVEKGILPIGEGEEIIYEIVPEEEVPEVPTPPLAPPIIKPEDVTLADVYNSLQNLGLIIRDTSIRNNDAIDALLVPLEEVKDLLQGEHDIREEYFEILYPADGGAKTIPKDATEINFVTGDVTLGDGTGDRLNNSLTAVGKPYMRSIFIDTNKEFKVQLDDGGKETIAANDFFLRNNRQFQRVSIEVSESASINLLASTNPEGVIKIVRNVIIKGDDSGTLRTVALDSGGNIVGVFKGDYDGTLKTLAVDDQGRMLAVLTDPEDVFDNPTYMGAAELAVRLGSISTFERRGNVIWMDDFEAPILRWKTTTLGGASIKLSTEQSLCGVQSAKFISGTGASRSCFLYRYLPEPRATKVGFEFAFTTSTNTDFLEFYGIVYDGTQYTYGVIRIVYDDDKIYYAKSDNGGYTWTDTGLSPQLQSVDYFFRRLKFVFDYGTHKWMRVFLDNEEEDLSNQPMFTYPDATRKQTLVRVSHKGDGVNTSHIFVDNIIITQNEP